MVTAHIPKGINKVTTDKPLYQWDYGQVLRITGDDLPVVCQVHFCDRSCTETKVRIGSQVDGGLEVVIPDILLENEWPINAFIYVVSENCGNTIKHIHIPVNKRKKPEDFVDPIPEDIQTELEKLIANINDVFVEVKESQAEIEELYSETITYEELNTIIDERVEAGISATEAKIVELEEKTYAKTSTIESGISTLKDKANKTNIYEENPSFEGLVMNPGSSVNSFDCLETGYWEIEVQTSYSTQPVLFRGYKQSGDGDSHFYAERFHGSIDGGSQVMINLALYCHQYWSDTYGQSMTDLKLEGNYTDYYGTVAGTRIVNIGGTILSCNKVTRGN